ncbi:MAG: mechanosensitive ion channel domain-containing protein [Verrucomicrobiota bacterium]
MRKESLPGSRRHVHGWPARTLLLVMAVVTGCLMGLQALSIDAAAAPAVAAAEAKTPAASGASAASDALSLETVEARLKVWKSSAVDSAVQKAVVPLAEEAASLLQQAAQSRTQMAAFQERAKNLPARAAEIRAGADKPVTLPDNLQPPPPGAEVDALEVAATRLHSDLEDARRAAAAARDLPPQNAARRKELTAGVSSHTARLLQLRTDSPGASAGEAPELTEARGMAQQAGVAAAQAQIDAAQAEIAWLDAADAISWPSLSLTAATRLQSALETAETELAQRIAQVRARTATTGVETAARNQASAPAELKPLLEQVTQRAGENKQVVEKLIPAADAELRDTEAGTRKWLDLALRTREKIRRLGATGVVGVELRQQRQSLPSPATLQVQGTQRQERLNAVEMTRLSLEEEIAALPPAETAVSNPETAAAQSQRDGLTTLLQSYDRYYNTLVRLEESAQQFRAVVQAHREFIHENILWIPSSAPAGRESIHSLGASLQWLISGWLDPSLMASWWQGVARAPLMSVLAVMALAFLFFLRHTGRHRLSVLARLADQANSKFRATAAAAVWTVVISLPWPALMWLLALPWQDSTLSTPFSLGLSASLQRTAVVLLGLEFARQPLRQGGLALAHFRWPAEVVRQLRWQFRHLSAVVLPCVLLGSLFRFSDETRHDPAERGFLVLQLLAAAWWVHRFWHLGRSQTGLPPRGAARLVWFVARSLSLLIPLTLIMLALRGYLYTSEVLTERLAVSLLAGAAFLLGKALFYRWYALHRRNLRAERARRLREAREAARAAASATAATSSNTPPGAGTNELPLDPPVTEITGSDIDEAGQEMRGLVDIIAFILAAAAAWAIWADVLPAAKNLANRPLDSVTALLSDSPPAAGAASSSGEKAASSPLPAGLTALVPSAALNPIGGTRDDSSGRTTWLGVILAMAAAVLTFLSARRIPGALQFLLTTQLSLDAGARFALSTITRYVIIIAGAVFTLGLVGITWSSVQWLAAALTVGLGFGLQEIFANFFSGLIILAERPIRPGDVITIDNITGSVARIQIRATTIRAGDGKDYIVPNKELITGKLLNWTRTDSITRQEIGLSVAYGTDPVAALRLLARIAAEHPAVMKDPAPVVSFEAFGESILRLFLRFHTANLDQRLPTLTDLNCTIAREFAAAGIGLPLPEGHVPVRPSIVPPL